MVITGLTIMLSIVTVKTSKTLQLVFSFVKGSTAASNFATTACFFFFFPPLDDLEKVSIGAWKRHFMLLCNYYRLADQPTDKQTDMGSGEGGYTSNTTSQKLSKMCPKNGQDV